MFGDPGLLPITRLLLPLLFWSEYINDLDILLLFNSGENSSSAIGIANDFLAFTFGDVINCGTAGTLTDFLGDFLLARIPDF